MKQAMLKKGMVIPVDIPEPKVKSGFIKIKVLYSCISTGTEMKGVKASQKSLLRKAYDNPQKVKQAFDVFRAKGLKETANKIVKTENSLKGLGYSISGTVTEVGVGVSGFEKGDVVAGGGHGFAQHAEYVIVPKNLVTKVPEGLNPKYAAIGTVGSIALHGVRRVDLKLGEFGVVFGAGLLGLLALQMLRASGVRVVCIDIDQSKLDLAKQLGSEITVNPNHENPVLAVKNWSNGFGADAVLFSAATTEKEPLSQAFQMCRKKGKVVMLGVASIQIDRSDMYRDEIDFLISTSYGPGRYDDKYELDGVDYPYPYVRWTENRNIAEFLRLMQENKVLISPLNPSITHISEVKKAYTEIESAARHSLVSLIDFQPLDRKNEDVCTDVISLSSFTPRDARSSATIGLIGAGGFATGTLLPSITSFKDKYFVKSVANRTGEKAHQVARQFGVSMATSDYQQLLKDDDINLIVISTRHGSHADLVMEALSAGKHVFVEKPLAINLEELKTIESFYKEREQPKPILMVGYNRRFSSYIVEVKKHLRDRQSPLFIRYRMNAGFRDPNHYVFSEGGRIIGEACHIIDLSSHLVGSDVAEVSVSSVNPTKGKFLAEDNKSITLKYKDGSVAVIDYFALGSQAFAKENLEVHFDGKSIVVDDYKSIEGYGVKTKSLKSKSPDKGHKEEWLHLYDGLKTGTFPIPLESLINTTYISILAANH